MASDSKRRVFLHVGPHKTGSTYIQRNLVNNREALAELGLCYPRTGQEILYGHHNLVKYLRGAKEVEFDLRSFRSEIGSGSDVVISSENFSALDKHGVERLRDILQDFEIVVIIFARARGPLLYSTWQEDVKHGYTISFPEFVSMRLARPYVSKEINKGLLIDLYAEVFGAEAIRLAVYDNIRQDLFQFFMARAVGVEPTGMFVDQTPSNVRMPVLLIELLRMVLHFAAPKTMGAAIALRNSFLRFCSTTNGQNEVTAWNEIVKSRLRRLDLTRLDQLYHHLDKELCRRLAGSIFESASVDRLFDNDASQREYLYLQTEDFVGKPDSLDRLRRLITAVLNTQDGDNSSTKICGSWPNDRTR